MRFTLGLNWTLHDVYQNWTRIQLLDVVKKARETRVVAANHLRPRQASSKLVEKVHQADQTKLKRFSRYKTRK